MRTRILKAAILAIAILVLKATPADAQEAPRKGSGDVTDVECYLNNYTEPSLRNEDGSYPVNMPIHLTTHITDPGNRVAKVTVYASQGNKGGVADEGWNQSFTWTQPTPGDWLLAAEILDVDGNVITPSGDCDVVITLTEDSSETEEKVDCAMDIFATKDQRNGGFITGESISLQLTVPMQPAMYWYFSASRIDGGPETRLSDGTYNFLVWTPTEPGTYVVRGEFISVKTGEPIEVIDPEKCKVTLAVKQAVSPEPTPTTTTVTTASATTDTATPIEVRPESAPAAAVPAVSAPTSASAAGLAETGMSSTLWKLTSLGLALMAVGITLLRKSRHTLENM